MSTQPTRRLVGSVAFAAALSLGLAACGGGGNSGDATATGGSGGSGPVTIEVWDYLGQGVSDTAMKKVVAEFEAKNADIKVKRTSFAFADLSKSIVQGGVAGSVPDVAIVDVVDNQNFAALGLLGDLGDDVKATADQFHPGPWSSTEYDGKSFGLPLNSNNLALYYNKAMFTEAKVTPPATWTDLKTTAKALTTPAHSGLAISAVKSEQGTFQYLPFLWQTGGDLNTFETDGATSLAYLKGLIDDGSMSSAVANYTQEDARTQFVTGKTAMMINGPWELQNLKDAAGLEFGVAPLPKDKAAATGLGGENAVTFAAAKQPEAAKKFVQFLTSTEGAQIYCDESGQLSARKDLAGKLKLSSDPDMQVFEKQLETAHARAYGGKYTEISAAVQEALQRALTGAATPEVAAKEAAGKITPLLG
ncbi:MAG: sugar ABC transporter substrate-binding protein [Dermatophilus congolensis]|nr:sugar ABC transporter substrate-binding protein [Dermatophilus congolensis]